MVRKAKFEVDAIGYAETQEGRPAWHHAREIVSNAFDESPYATECITTLKKEGHELAVLTVSDNGRGFEKLEYAWTFYLTTRKRSDPTSRGRWTKGEKDWN